MQRLSHDGQKGTWSSATSDSRPHSSEDRQQAFLRMRVPSAKPVPFRGRSRRDGRTPISHFAL